MASFSHTVAIPRSPEDVFPWLLEADRVPRWTGHLDVYEPVSGGPLGVGSRVRQALTVSGQEIAVELEITRYDPPRGAESRFSAHGIDVVNQYALEAADGGTRLTQSLEAKPRSLSARMLAPIVQPKLERKLTEDLERLRALLEDGA
jgi:uncharacterized protein YndB with AHSA1/START domain